MVSTHEGKSFPAPESFVSGALRGRTRRPAPSRGVTAAPAAPSDRARLAMAAAARRRLEAWARHALAANGFGAAAAEADDGKP